MSTRSVIRLRGAWPACRQLPGLKDLLPESCVSLLCSPAPTQFSTAVVNTRRENLVWVVSIQLFMRFIDACSWLAGRYRYRNAHSRQTCKVSSPARCPVTSSCAHFWWCRRCALDAGSGVFEGQGVHKARRLSIVQFFWYCRIYGWLCASQ